MLENIYLWCNLLLSRVLKFPQWISLILKRLRKDGNSASSTMVATSMDLCTQRSLAGILGFSPGFFSRLLRSEHKTILGWGRKWSGARAVAIAERDGTEFVLLEDGFLRSCGRLDDTLSIVFDRQGIYYDATHPSEIEELIATSLTMDEVSRSADVIEKWREFGLSKYNAEREYSGALPEKYVLVLDQVASDMSIEYGEADAESFHQMLNAALKENPSTEILVKLHPDVFTRAKKSHFDIEALQQLKHVRVIAENCHPVRLIANAETVYTVTSQVGFEALIWGKRVRCFGMPFYAGWGLTIDELPPSGRRGTATLEKLVHGALIKYPRYFDPETGMECQVERAMEHLGLQRRMLLQYPKDIYATNFSKWKLSFLKKILRGSDIELMNTTADIPKEATVVCWGNLSSSGLPNAKHILSVEDGFLRSSGLGADLIQPLSWMIDNVGLYYDATRPSKLEQILQNADFTNKIINRSKALRSQIVSARITKYNLGGQSWQRPTGVETVILVAGQVENDASIQFGSVDIKTNIDLLRAVRASHPDAYIVYKPHPDVAAGLRRAEDGNVGAYCNEIVNDTDPIELLAALSGVVN